MHINVARLLVSRVKLNIINTTPTDNSAMESINGWIKAELFMDFHVTGERPVYEEVNEYIKFFNEERPAYALSYLTPKQYRERYAA